MMKQILKFLSLGLVALGAGSAPAAGQGFGLFDPENTLYMDLPMGRVVIQMRPDKAPNHVARIKELVRRGFYDGLVFHRVIEGFMAQTGDPLGTGEGGSSLPDLKAEFNDLPHLRGTVSMARTNDPDSANSQFFIMFMPAHHLDGKYTVWGRVVSGMQYVDQIARGEPPRNPTPIVRMRVAADVMQEEGQGQGGL
ncbi:MAG: peptidylprolyl isomerase [Rhodothalassiaceae bacterium]